jgi:hypothetical protein
LDPIADSKATASTQAIIFNLIGRFLLKRMNIVAVHFLALGGPTPKAYFAQPPGETRDFPSVASGSRSQVSGERVLAVESVAVRHYR